MTEDLVARAERGEYSELFIKDLHWSAPDLAPIEFVADDGSRFVATNVSSYRGIRVWVCSQRPGSQLQAKIEREIAKTSTDRLVIFHDETDQVWRWPVRRVDGHATKTRLASHRHRTGSTTSKLGSRLDAIRLPLDAPLHANAVLARVRAAFDVETQNETRHASKLMARMYEALEKAYPDGSDPRVRDHEISVTLARILFLMFGDDTDMWEADLFRDFVHTRTGPDGIDIGRRLNDLFVLLDSPESSEARSLPSSEAFPYVNGGIFDERITLPEVNAEFRAAVLDACAVDWSTVSPAIFGSMFQSVRDARTRRELGEHYTSEENILKTLQPLFLDELEAEFERAATMKNEALILRRLWDRLGRIRFIDPACGCGNFIIIAYRELRDLELRIMERLQEISGKKQLYFDPTTELKVTLENFYGIEIDEWPARIAETAMFLIDRQCDLKLKERFGEAPQRLPIQREATILSGVSALAIDWADLLTPSDDVVVAGNPPFLGISLRSDAQTDELRAAWGADRYHGTLDYVTGWHAKALDYFREVDGRWAFVTTNSVTQGEAVAPLFEPILEEAWGIQFAHRTFRWTSEATGQAAVHCVIVGFSRGPSRPRLFDYPTPTSPPEERPRITNITPYLTDGPTVIVRPSTKPVNQQLGEVAYGNKPTDGGFLIVDPDDHADVMRDPIASRYIRPYIGARELLHGHHRYCFWLVDATDDDLEASPVLRERMQGVRAFRRASKAASTRNAADSPQLFRQISQPNAPYLCIPRHVSESRPYFLAARFGPEVVTSDANFLALDEDGFMFSVISSTAFLTWQRTVGGRLKSDLRFNKLLTWNTFPLPHVDHPSRTTIVEAGAAVLSARDRQRESSLADMYDPATISSDLLVAHVALDEEVDRLFDLETSDATVLDRQDTLFSRYADLTSPVLETPTTG
jgi:hypothetical protein